VVPSGQSEPATSASPEERLSEAGLFLPHTVRSAPSELPIALFRYSADLVWISGRGPVGGGAGEEVQGKIGSDLSKEQGRAAATATALEMLWLLRHELGSLSAIRRWLKVVVFVCCVDDFRDHPYVANGFSDVINKAFGPDGAHARSAVGVSSLPFGVPVEIEAVLELAANERTEKEL
jgi:enamine deaminase RidA (YjgF/YER057c/UK114 family)